MATGEAAAPAQGGFYCSTSGTYFTDKESLAEHYKSDFHRYNLKRKVAGLPPVTKDWFDARKAQLTSVAASSPAAPAARTWVDPLTKKKFASENTYLAFVRSKKYQELVKKSGQAAPAPLILTRKEQEAAEAAQASTSAPAPLSSVAATAATGFKVVMPSGRLPLRQEDDQQMADADADEDMDGGDDDDDDGSGWETASDEDAEAMQAAAKDGGEQQDGKEWPEWDVRRSLFDNHMSPSLEANLEYMLKKFGFYIPDAEYLKDPEGLIKYLGAKLQVGGVPLYVRGDDPNGRQFRSLHAVQRHMVDRNSCRMAYDDNEDEYAEFYDYDMAGGEGEQDSGDEAGPLAVVAGSGVGPTTPNAIPGELVLVAADGSGGKILGTRDLARYYRQRHRPDDERRSVVVNTMLAKYRALAIPTNTDDRRDVATKKAATMAHGRVQASVLKMSMIRNNLKKLPKNCEY